MLGSVGWVRARAVGVSGTVWARVVGVSGTVWARVVGVSGVGESYGSGGQWHGVGYRC